MNKLRVTYTDKASNWILRTLDQIHINLHEINLLEGGVGSIVLPSSIKFSKCVINFDIGTNSQRCFTFAVLVALHYREFSRPERLHQYMQYIDEFDFRTITFPVNSIETQKFEKTNPTISVL